MQRTAICGLFVAIRNSMVDTTAYTKLQQQVQSQSDSCIPVIVNGRLATWRTYMGYGISWNVRFKDAALGAWSFSFSPDGSAKSLLWYPNADELRHVDESEIQFDDATFVRMFEALRVVAGAYIKYYGFSVDHYNRVFVAGLVAP
jgi:hypothetical protein